MTCRGSNPMVKTHNIQMDVRTRQLSMSVGSDTPRTNKPKPVSTKSPTAIRTVNRSSVPSPQSSIVPSFASRVSNTIPSSPSIIRESDSEDYKGRIGIGSESNFPRGPPPPVRNPGTKHISTKLPKPPRGNWPGNFRRRRDYYRAWTRHRPRGAKSRS